VTKLLLSIHVLAAIVAIGPVTVAASMFPAATRRALAAPADPREAAVLRNLHRICRVYAALGVLVPVFGLATASSLGVLGDAWLIISIFLTVAAAAVLMFLVLPGQATVLHDLDRSRNIPREDATADRADENAPGRFAAGASRPAADQPGQAATAKDNLPRSHPQIPTVTAEDNLPRHRPHEPAMTAHDLTHEPAMTAEDIPPRAQPPGFAVTAGDNRRRSRPEGPLPAAEAAGSPDGAIRARRMAARLGMVTGAFNLLWAVVVVLMIVRPGSTTGA
jgi:uncharacterized membrane protein